MMTRNWYDLGILKRPFSQYLCMVSSHTQRLMTSVNMSLRKTSQAHFHIQWNRKMSRKPPVVKSCQNEKKERQEKNL